jgi:hypothetical protein
LRRQRRQRGPEEVRRAGRLLDVLDPQALPSRGQLEAGGSTGATSTATRASRSAPRSHMRAVDRFHSSAADPSALPSRLLRPAGPPMGVVMPRPRPSHPRPLRGNVGSRRDAPPTGPAGRQLPRFPDRQPRRSPRGARTAQFPIVRRSAQKRPFRAQIVRG